MKKIIIGARGSELSLAYANKVKKLLLDKVNEIIGKDMKNKRITFLGVTFKPNTDDMRDSTSLNMIPYVARKGAKVFYYDPTGEKKELKNMKNVNFSKNINTAIIIKIITPINTFVKILVSLKEFAIRFAFNV